MSVKSISSGSSSSSSSSSSSNTLSTHSIKVHYSYRRSSVPSSAESRIKKLGEEASGSSRSSLIKRERVHSHPISSSKPDDDHSSPNHFVFTTQGVPQESTCASDVIFHEEDTASALVSSSSSSSSDHISHTASRYLTSRDPKDNKYEGRRSSQGQERLTGSGISYESTPSTSHSLQLPLPPPPPEITWDRSKILSKLISPEIPSFSSSSSDQISSTAKKPVTQHDPKDNKQEARKLYKSRDINMLCYQKMKRADALLKKGNPTDVQSGIILYREVVFSNTLCAKPYFKLVAILMDTKNYKHHVEILATLDMVIQGEFSEWEIIDALVLKGDEYEKSGLVEDMDNALICWKEASARVAKTNSSRKRASKRMFQIGLDFCIANVEMQKSVAERMRLHSTTREK